MTDNPTTPFSNKVSILADLWINYKNDEEFSDFLQYNDLGLPLAYAIDNKIVEPTPLAESFISETFDLLIDGLNIETDTGFESLDEMLGLSEE